MSATGTDIARVESRIPQAAEIRDLTVLGNQLGQSGFFKDVRTGHQAFAKLLFGRDLGLSATAAMTGVHIIEGKPEISANVQAQMVRTYIGPEGERYKYLVREHDNEHCKIEFFCRERGKEWELIGVSNYTMRDAENAQLAGKGNWQKHPRNMLFARAMSDGVAFHCPEVTNGIRTYHEGEIEGDVGQAGAVADVTFEPASQSGEVIEGQVVEGPASENGTGTAAASMTATSRPAPKVTARAPQRSQRPMTPKQEGAIKSRCATAGVTDAERDAIAQWAGGKILDRLESKPASAVITALGDDGANAREILAAIIAAAAQGDERARQIVARHLMPEATRD